MDMLRGNQTMIARTRASHIAFGRLPRPAAILPLVLAGFLAPAPAAAQGPPRGDIELGQYLSSECVTCHQELGRAEGVPAIVGWPDEQFVAVMLSYKNRERPNQIMQTIAGRLSQAEIEALAAWFGAEPPAEPAR